ncbi:hypothetical protein EDB80DRAFT_718501 [Ilyonectria destructans]|nr:hypothetical protein EDB80DRAFT_718501 [Ilyonectria destructans]
MFYPAQTGRALALSTGRGIRGSSQGSCRYRTVAHFEHAHASFDFNALHFSIKSSCSPLLRGRHSTCVLINIFLLLLASCCVDSDDHALRCSPLSRKYFPILEGILSQDHDFFLCICPPDPPLVERRASGVKHRGLHPSMRLSCRYLLQSLSKAQSRATP